MVFLPSYQNVILIIFFFFSDQFCPFYLNLYRAVPNVYVSTEPSKKDSDKREPKMPQLAQGKLLWCLANTLAWLEMKDGSGLGHGWQAIVGICGQLK